MASGDVLLDSDGNRILDDDGNAQLSDDAGDDCCCGGDTCPSGKKCFQEWLASWDCPSTSWTGPTSDNRLCLPTGTDTGWIKIAGDASGCLYRKYVPYTPAHCCTVNGDCSALGDTATPALPFGGAEPTDCCYCEGTCGCRSVGKYAVVSFAGVENGMPCTDCRGAFRRAGTLVLGTYTLTKGTGCFFSGVATGLFFESATGVEGGDCPPDEDFHPGEVEAFIELAFDAGAGRWGIEVHVDDFQFFVGDGDQGDCTGAVVMDNQLTAYDPCGDVNFACMINGTATVVFPPCVPV